MDELRFRHFLKQLAAGDYTNEEHQAFVRWTETCSREEYLQMLEVWKDIIELAPTLPLVESQLHTRIEAALDHFDAKSVNEAPLRLTPHWFKLGAIAASILIVLSFGAYFFMNQHVVPSKSHGALVAQTLIKPGKNAATLTLANGKKIVLSDAVKGELAKEDGVSITKTANGQIVYTIKETAAAAPGQYNTLSTANGETYKVNLPDGTAVWLNAASALKYPVKFDDKARIVELQGEAYFEVAKNPLKPFRVTVYGSQDIEVLGTHFNVKAYSDDRDIKTTLLEGSVKLTAKNGEVILKPGQTAINNLTGKLRIMPANIDQAIAWKNGLFVFDDETIQEAAKTAARWYDVDFEYKGDVAKKKLWGTVSKYKSIRELLDDMTITSGIHYTIEGRRVILTN